MKNARYFRYLLLLLLFACGSSSKIKFISSAEGYKAFKYKESLALKHIREQIFKDRDSWPSLYTSFGNVNYFFGEELRIKEIYVQSIKFDGKYSESVTIDLFGNEIKQNESLPYNYSNFSHPLTIPTSTSQLNAPLVVELNILVESYNEFKFINYSLAVSLSCKEGVCLEPQGNGVKYNKVVKIDSKPKKSSQYEEESISIKDPLLRWRKNKLVLSKALRRLVWIGMPTQLLNSYGIDKKLGSFTCLKNKLCRSGYHDIRTKNNKVINYQFKKDGREVVK